MAKQKQKKTYSPAEKKRRIRRHNRIVYTIAVLLLLAGIIIIISDQTLLFPRAWKWFSGCVGITKDTTPSLAPQEQSPDFVWITADPNDMTTHWNITITDDTTHEIWTPVPYDPYGNPITPGPSETAGATPRPGTTPDPNATPRPTRPPTTHAPVAPTSPFAPKTVYFLNRYTAAQIDDVTCPVDPVGYNSNGQMDTVHSAYRAGWFMYGGDPVHGGNTLIAGHNRYSGRKGWFSIIQEGKLQPGDIVVVELNSGDYTYFMVDSITTYEYDAVPDEVMNTGGRPRLTLITCLGDYSSIIHTSRHRVIAVCYPVYFGNEGEQTTPEPTQPQVTAEPTQPQVTPEPTQSPDAGRD